MKTPETTLAALLDAYQARDAAALGALVADDVRMWVTNAGGGVDPLDGSQMFVGALLSLEAPVFTIDMTQLVRVSDDQAMAMVEIHAERDGRTLHNFSAFLARVVDERIAEMWMVEALPAVSAEFWS